MAVVKIIPRSNAVLVEYPTGISKTFLLNSYLTASATGDFITIVTDASEYVLVKYPFQAIRDGDNTVYGATAAATVTALNYLFIVPETDVSQLKVDFDDLNGRALDNTSKITDLANVENFDEITQDGYMLTVNGSVSKGVKVVSPITFISGNNIATQYTTASFTALTATTSLYLGNNSTGIIFEGGTADNNETTLQAINPTLDRTIYLPDASGTVALVGTNGDASFDSIVFDLTPTSTDSDGRLLYDVDLETLVFTTAHGNKLSLGSTYLPVINKTGTTIPLGSAVKATGVEGQRFTIALFDADVDNELYFIGLTEKAIATESEGVVVSVGYVKGINTSTYTAGTILYASGTPGGLTTTIPTKPAAQIVACMVTTQSANGSVFVRNTIYHDLVESRDVDIPSPTAGVMIQRNAANTLWVKSPFSFPTADGTANQVLKTNGSGTLSWSTPATLDNTNVTLIDDREIDLNNFSLTIYNGASVVAGFGLNVQTIYGDVRLNTNNGTPGKISFYESTTGGSTNYVSLSAPASLSANTNYILPAADGSSGQVLSTNGSGTLSWATASGGGGTPAGNTGEIQFNNGGSFGASSGFFWDNTNGRLGVGLNTGLTNEITASVASVDGIASFNTAASSATAGSNITVYSNDNAALISGDRLGGFNFGGSTGVGTIGTGASIQAFSAGTYAPASIPSVMTFSTVPGAASTLAERMRIFNDGNIAIGDTSTLAKLSIRGTGSTSGSSSLIIRNSGAATLFQVRDDGKCVIGTGGVDGAIMLNIRGATSTSSGSTLRLWNSNSITTFQIRDDGAYTFFGGSLGLAQTGYTTFTNLNTLRTGDANTLTLGQLCDIVGTLILDLKTKGIIAS
jgi:hypothetical protein